MTPIQLFSCLIVSSSLMVIIPQTGLVFNFVCAYLVSQLLQILRTVSTQTHKHLITN